jgi:hypothetical protein
VLVSNLAIVIVESRLMAFRLLPRRLSKDLAVIKGEKWGVETDSQQKVMIPKSVGVTPRTYPFPVALFLFEFLSLLCLGVNPLLRKTITPSLPQLHLVPFQH